jgi:hypothetical protein
MISFMDETESTLDRLLDPIAGCLTPDVARRIADLRTDDRTMARLETLRPKANQGTLLEAERAEYDEIVEALDLFSILKAKAQAVLSKHAS